LRAYCAQDDNALFRMPRTALRLPLSAYRYFLSAKYDSLYPK
jgi:hypothetical protein